MTCGTQYCAQQQTRMYPVSYALSVVLLDREEAFLHTDNSAAIDNAEECIHTVVL
jgi:hypothetical protein